MIVPEGQINRGMALGEYIYHLAWRDDVDVIVEVGAWNGCGTTKCIRDAVLRKCKPCSVLSLESSGKWFAEAIKNNQPQIVGFNIVHGRLVEPDDLKWISKSVLNSQEQGWYDDDVKDYGTCPNVLASIPEKIDLLILDGGEYSSKVEFENLAPRVRFIVMDDTCAPAKKFAAVRDRLLSYPSHYEILLDQPKDRNGYMVLRNTTLG